MPLCFLGTALSREQQSLLQKCAAKLGAKVIEEYTSEGMCQQFMSCMAEIF